MASETREKVVEIGMQCYTVEECRQAQRAVEQWIREHPDDWNMYELARSVATMRAAAEEEEQQQVAASQKAA